MKGSEMAPVLAVKPSHCALTVLEVTRDPHGTKSPEIHTALMVITVQRAPKVIVRPKCDSSSPMIQFRVTQTVPPRVTADSYSFQCY